MTKKYVCFHLQKLLSYMGTTTFDDSVQKKVSLRNKSFGEGQHVEEGDGTCTKSLRMQNYHTHL